MARGPQLFRHDQFAPSRLVAAKGDLRISVCIPARNEAATVGSVVSTVHDLLSTARGVPLVDEVVVVDDGSVDDTADVARRAGAAVLPAGTGEGGKGLAMAAGAAATTGDVVVFLDADVEDFGPHFVTGLVGPLVEDSAVQMVKAFYERPIDGRPSGGGRVTELVARPVIALLFPELSHILQPLAGETAVRRAVLDRLVLEPDYGVEIGMLIDVAEDFGTNTIAQVDLGTRSHRNRPVDELAPQATDVLRAALHRAGAVINR